MKIVVAFLTVYLVWGSTYLAIRIGVSDLPPGLFAGARFIISGVLLGSYAHLRGIAFPRSPGEWKTMIIVAVLLLVGGNGLVVWGEQWVPSNQAALTVATTALWIAGLGTLGPQGQPLTWQTRLGLAIGFLGVAILLLPHGTHLSSDHFWGQLAILLSPLLWASGSIFGKRRRPATPPLMSAALQMFIGGLILSTIGLAAGETREWVWTVNGLAALVYLVVFGSLAFAAYVWLLHTVTPSQLGTYAYVNPAIAVILGWWILGESLGPEQVLGMLIILLGVVLVSTSRSALLIRGKSIQP